MKFFSDEIAKDVDVLQNIINNTLLGFKSFYGTCENKYKSLRRRTLMNEFLVNAKKMQVPQMTISIHRTSIF